MGIESALDARLRGSAVLLQRRRDRHGLDVERLDVVDRSRSRGLDVETTIDRHIQRFTEQALANVMERSEPKAATAIVVDVDTGDILALANVPTFNPNDVGNDPNLRRNRAIQDAIEPGSVFKIFTIAGAMEEGIVSADTPVDCEGGRYRVGSSTIGDDHPKGVISVAEIVKFSNNIGTAKQALRMGPTAFLGYLKRFGFAERTGVELPHERRGFLRDAGRAKSIELATTSYGQGATATPLQLAMATATIANEGVRMKPRLITRVVDEFGVPEAVIKPEVATRVLSPEVARSMSQVMVGVTEPGGTATRARVPGFHVAGKTGTAWKVQNGRYTDARIGSFVGFLPADRPEIAIVVVVDEPQKGSRFGGIVAAPAFSEIGAAAMKYLGVRPDPAQLEADSDGESPDEEPEVSPREPVRLVRDGTRWYVPDLKGRGLREALVALQGSGIRIAATGTGTAVAQTPPPGTPITGGDIVSITFR
jgi:cell division protein FtsI (penicillin-binding protein 3)